METSEIRSCLTLQYPNMELVEIDKTTFVFEERVKQKCFHCKNYGYKWTCPPRLPQVDYPMMFQEYDHAAVLIYKAPICDSNFEEERFKSTNQLHKALLYLEKVLYENNSPMALSFIGGSCKLCKNGCNKEKCVNPYLSRIPWEATGCNVVKTLKKNGIEVAFPLTDYIYRYGLFLW